MIGRLRVLAHCLVLGHAFPHVSRGELVCGRCARRWTCRSDA